MRENIKMLFNNFLIIGVLEPRTQQYILGPSYNKNSSAKVLHLFDFNRIYGSKNGRLAPVLKTIFHQCATSYTYSQSNSDGSVLKVQVYKYMIWHIDEKML